MVSWYRHQNDILILVVVQQQTADTHLVGVGGEKRISEEANALVKLRVPDLYELIQRAPRNNISQKQNGPL